MFEDLEGRRAEVERHRENRARLAQAFAKFESHGQGSVEFGERVDFGLTFIEEPYVSYGAQLDLDELGDLLGIDPEDSPPLPLCSGLVTEWDRDDRDFYIGAWLAVRVAFPTGDPVPLDAEVHLHHHFTFQAVALKDVPLDVRD